MLLCVIDWCPGIWGESNRGGYSYGPSLVVSTSTDLGVSIVGKRFIVVSLVICEEEERVMAVCNLCAICCAV